MTERCLDGVTIAVGRLEVTPVPARIGMKPRAVERAVLALLRRGRPPGGEKLAELIRAERAKRTLRRAA